MICKDSVHMLGLILLLLIIDHISWAEVPLQTFFCTLKCTVCNILMLSKEALACLLYIIFENCTVCDSPVSDTR